MNRRKVNKEKDLIESRSNDRTFVRSGICGQKKKQRQAFWRMLAALWKALEGKVGKDVGRLKEAGLRIVETTAGKRAAQAQAKAGQAAEQLAGIDIAKQEAALKAMQAATKIANNLAASGDKRAAQDLRKMLGLAAKLQLAISMARQGGGQVVFDRQEITELLRKGLEEFPDDPILREVEPKLLRGFRVRP